MKQKIITASVAGILAVTSLTVACAAQYKTPDLIEGPTTFRYKLFDTEESYEEELEAEMPDVYAAIEPYVKEDKVCPIPGILNTCYSDSGTLMNSMYYIPQGICMTESYILTTAYHDGKIGGEVVEDAAGWSGALYVIDKDTLELLCTLGLPQAYHNGGIAYDGENVWFCGNTSDKYLNSGGNTFVQCCKYSVLQALIKIAQLDENKAAAVIASDFSDPIYINNKPSFLTCTEGMLWVGTYINNDPNENDGFAIGYPIQNAKRQNPTLDIIDVSRINGIPSSAQGLDFSGQYLYVSSSGHGGENYIKSSYVSKYDVGEIFNGSSLVDVEGKAVKRIEVPKMNEEVVVDDENVYLIFEAASEKFLASLPLGMKTDRILVIDKTLWE